MKKYYKAILDNCYKGKYWLSNRFRKAKESDPTIQILLKRGIIVEREPEKIVIEKALHPLLKIGKYEIGHRHTGRFIYFSVWDENGVVGNESFRFDRQVILHHDKDFYKNYEKDFQILVNNNTKIEKETTNGKEKGNS